MRSTVYILYIYNGYISNGFISYEDENISVMEMVMKHTITFEKIFCKITCFLHLFLINLYLLQCFLLQKDDNLNALFYPKADITCEILPTLTASVAKVLSADPPLTLLGTACKQITA